MQATELETQTSISIIDKSDDKTIAKRWKQFKCPSMEEWIIYTHIYIHIYIYTTYKQNGVHVYNEILFTLKNEWNSVTCYNVDELWRHNAKQNQPVMKKQAPYDMSYMRYLK